MKLLLDFLPVILFFITFKVAESDKALAADFANRHFGELFGDSRISPAEAPVMLATLVVIAATLAQVLWLKWRGRKVDAMLWVSLGLVVVLGGLTLWFHSETFIKWKPTIFCWMMAAGLIIGELVMKRDVLSQMMGGQLELPQAVWRRLTWAWITFFVFMGFLNLYIAYNYPTDVWVNYKMWGITILTLLFVVGQSLYLSKHITTEPQERS